MRNVWILALAMASATAGSSAMAAPPIEEYGRLPAVEHMDLSPSGRDLAYIAVDGDARKIVVQQVGGPVVVAAAVGSNKVREVAWLDDDHVLLTVSTSIVIDPGAAIAKGEFFQSLVLNITTGKAVQVFRSQQKILHATYRWYGLAHIGGRTFGYFGGETLQGGGAAMADFDRGVNYADRGIIDLYKVDLDNGDPEKVSGGVARYYYDWVVGSDGAVVGESSYYGPTGEWLLYTDPASGKPIQRLIDPAGDVGIVGLGRTEGSVLVQQPGEDGDWSLIEYLHRGGPGVAPFHGRSMKSLLRDPVSRLLIGGVTNDNQPETILFDQTLQAKFDKLKKAFPGEIVELVAATSNLDKMIVLTTGAQDSGTYFLVDIAAGKAEAVGWLHPKILLADVGEVRIVPYKAADGLAMEGVLTLPPGRAAKALPLIVLPHGGPEARDYAGFDWWAQAYASRGYAVFQPNFRGSDGYGKAFRDAGYGQWGRKMQTDISDGMAELARQGLVDPKRACIVGGSYGGYAALAGVTLQQGLYRCAVSVGGVSDLGALRYYVAQTYGVESAATRSDALYMGGGSLSETSPVHFAARADAPVLLIYGKDDTVVPPVQSTAMQAALKSAGKNVELIALPSEDHWLSREATRTQMLTASVAFIEKYNPPD